MQAFLLGFPWFCLHLFGVPETPLPHVLLQKLQRSRPGEFGARRIVAFPLVAVEAVIGGIDVDLDVRMGGGHLFHSGDGAMRVLLAEMEKCGRLGRQALEPGDPTAVKADRGAQARKLAARSRSRSLWGLSGV